MASQSNIKVKVCLNQDTRVWRYASRADFDGLRAFIADSWNHASWIAQYKDDENDLITIACAQDLQDAFDNVEHEQKRSLKIFVQPINEKVSTDEATQVKAEGEAEAEAEEKQEEKEKEKEEAKQPFASLHDMALNFLNDAKIMASIPALVGAVIAKIKSTPTDEPMNADQIAALITCEVGDNEKFAALRAHALYKQYAAMAIPCIAGKIAMQQSLLKHFHVGTVQKWVTQLIDMVRDVASRPGGLCAYKNAVLDIEYPDKTDDGQVIHYGVECDVCGEYPIIGDRYKSVERHNWDCCAKCEPQHEQPLIKFKKARSVYRGRAFRRLSAFLRRLDCGARGRKCAEKAEAQPKPAQEEPKVDDISVDISCVCGSPMHKVVAKRAYRDCNTVYCDLCNKQFFNEQVYHCPIAKNSAVHDNGYDVCLQCAQSQVVVAEHQPQQLPQIDQDVVAVAEIEEHKEDAPAMDSESVESMVVVEPEAVNEPEPEPEAEAEPEQIEVAQEVEVEAEAEVEVEEPAEVFVYQSELEQIKDIMGIPRDENDSDMVFAIKQLLVDNKGDVVQVVPALFN